MDRAPHADAIGGHGPADRTSETSDSRDRASRASPSYVEAVLFGRRPRGSSLHGNRSDPHDAREKKAGVANEQERN